MRWETLDDWTTIRPLLPVVTVEGSVVWFRRCQARTLIERYGDGFDRFRHLRRLTQYRLLPVSEIWNR